MICVDTNVLVRLLTADDRAQHRKARSLFEGEHVHLSLTVLLETEWVLRHAYGFDSKAIARALTDLASLERVSVEAEARLIVGLQGLQAGMDFADALHLAGCPKDASRFATFDRTLVRKARAAGLGRAFQL